MISILPPTPPGTQPPLPPGSPQPQRAKPWWKKRWGIALIAVAALFVIGSIGNLSGDRSASDAATPSSTAVARVSEPPAKTGEPTASEEPTQEAAASPDETAEPTAEPTPESTEAPDPTPAKPLLDKQGRGDKVLKFTAIDGPMVARITAKSSSNFAVTAYAGTSYDDLLVNEIGNYSGRVYLNPGVDRLKIESNGNWTVQLLPLEAARLWDGQAGISGKGDNVVVLSGGAFGTTTIKNKGRSNFAVIAYGESGEYLDLLVNEIGSYSGEVLLPLDDSIVLVVQDVGGTWSMSAVE
jgi:hypothetical protein